MKILLAICSIFITTLSHSQGLESFTAFGLTVGYVQPDPTRWNLVGGGIDSTSGKYLLMYKSHPLENWQGKKIEPVIAVVVEELAQPFDLMGYSEWKREQVPFEVIATMTYEDGHFSYPESIGYEGTYDENDVSHRMFVAHMLHGSVGIQIICDSTEDVFEKVERTMRLFIHSVAVD